jgi:hypothetical protein
MEEYTSSDDDDEVSQSPSTSASAINTSKPWLVEFEQYLNGVDDVPAGVALVEWWGVR